MVERGTETALEEEVCANCLSVEDLHRHHVSNDRVVILCAQCHRDEHRKSATTPKLQIYLDDQEQEALDKYIAEKFSPNSRVVSAVVRKAVHEFLKGEGYLP